jgi:hypothetical protein
LECRPKGSKPRRVYDASTYRGRGVTPDLAYLDLLGKTADELSILYGFTTGRDVSRSSRVLEELADVLVSRSTLGSPRTSLIILTWLMPSAKEDQVSGKHRSEASQRKKRGTRKRERQGNELTSRDEEVEEKKSILSSKTLLVIRGIMLQTQRKQHHKLLPKMHLQSHRLPVSPERCVLNSQGTSHSLHRTQTSTL